MGVVNINSEASCRKAYLNYHCYGNTMKISAEEMGEITAKWESRLSSWQATISNDDNQYEFDDSDYSKYKDKGKKIAQDETGFDGSKAKMKRDNGIEGALSGLGGVRTVVTAITSKGNSTKVSDIITVSLCSVVAALYYILNPNKKEKEACDELQDIHQGSMETLAETQETMEEMSNELVSLSDEASEKNEEANQIIEENKTNYDSYKESFTSLRDKAASKQPLTASEKQLYAELVSSMSETGSNIKETQEETSNEVGDIYDDMGDYQDGFDDAAETMGEVEGITDFAESFDKYTQAMCYVEGAAQTLNTVSAGTAAAKLIGKGPIGWIFAAIGFGAAAASGWAAAKQFKMAGDVGNEIEIRKETQDLNTATMDIYTEEIDAYDGLMTGVEDLTLDIPKDIEPPTDTALPDNSKNPAGVPEDTPDALVPNNKKDKEQE